MLRFYTLSCGHAVNQHKLNQKERGTAEGKMKQKHTGLDISTIELDTGNPRIRGALEKYKKGEAISPERIYLALQTGGDEGAALTGFYRLQSSIRARGSISIPITVVRHDDGRLVCIDGNTRLAIYQDFDSKKAAGNWNKISALLIEGATPVEIEEIRITAHLVGARPWPAYEKAKYLHDQYYSGVMNDEQLMELCGGNRKELRRQIDAYADMEEYYRPRLENDGHFDHTRFSGFVELQKPGWKEAIFDAGYELEDFADWINDGRIRRLEDVRLLPKVLSDDEATETFVKGGVDSIKKGIRIINEKHERNNPDMAKISKASLQSLVRVLDEKISTLPFNELQELKNDADLLNGLDNLSNNIASVFEAVGVDAGE